MKPSFAIGGGGYNRDPRNDAATCDDGEHRWSLKERAREGDDSSQTLKCRTCGATDHVSDAQRATSAPYRRHGMTEGD